MALMLANNSVDEELSLSLNAIWEDDADYQYFDGLRTKYYPPELLFNSAHIGLFTRLQVPVSLRAQIFHDIREVTRTKKPFRFKFQSKPCLWGKTIVCRVNAPPLERIRRELNNRWESLGVVDKGERIYTPHVTVHARVSKQTARSLFDGVQTSFAARYRSKGCPHGKIVGVQLLEFVDEQPYQHVASFLFGKD